VPVYASTRTKTLLGTGGDAITHAFEATARIDLGDLDLELFYPGAGHAPDNIVVHVREEHLLFGGCLVRAGETKGLGNLEDADLPAWPATMDRVMERYGSARTVVPGHGRSGDASLLLHTRTLAEQAAAGKGP
jgi:glyoxylase-like metal-dependent hydrolase (beta-lactamase superfamily II)